MDAVAVTDAVTVAGIIAKELLTRSSSSSSCCFSDPTAADVG